MCRSGTPLGTASFHLNPAQESTCLQPASDILLSHSLTRPSLRSPPFFISLLGDRDVATHPSSLSLSLCPHPHSFSGPTPTSLPRLLASVTLYLGTFARNCYAQNVARHLIFKREESAASRGAVTSGLAAPSQSFPQAEIHIDTSLSPVDS